jgi:hypothetical protein
MKIIYTSALIDSFYEERKLEYKNCIEYFIKKKLFNDLFVVETVVGSNSFLELEYNANVFYSHTYNESIKNKGVKEILAIKRFLEDNPFDDEEMVVKMTGRYLLIDNYFLDEVQKKEFDAYVKKASDGQVFFGCFAIKNKIFKKFINSINLDKLEADMKNVELEFSEFLNIENVNHKDLNSLGVYSNINNQAKVYW